MNRNIILATNKNGVRVKISDLEAWIKNKQKKELADFVFDRLHGRYIRPFTYNNSAYRKYYKNGFAIMANCCLLIETFMSFKDDRLINTNGNSERCFGIFFTTESRFSEFAYDGLSTTQYNDFKVPMQTTNKGIPKQFYQYIRCGILHSGETRGGWKILREGPLFDRQILCINATHFSKQLERVLIEFRQTLISEDIRNSNIWSTYLKKLNDIIIRA